jgi:hypothetical protein
MSTRTVLPIVLSAATTSASAVVGECLLIANPPVLSIAVRLVPSAAVPDA